MDPLIIAFSVTLYYLLPLLTFVCCQNIIFPKPDTELAELDLLMEVELLRSNSDVSIDYISDENISDSEDETNSNESSENLIHNSNG
tara:strand:+ start:238 stop:498 length:261 start_codon:yes stop_codon:yes gene_type:complete